MRPSRELEILVANIQKQLAPDAVVIHDAKLPSRTTTAMRQIDVLVQQKVGQYTLNIVIDSKDYKTPVDVKGIETFYGLFSDVHAHKGVLVCPAGFTKAAKERAKALMIDLYSPVDTGDHKWRTRLTIPTVCDFRGARMGFSIQFSEPFPFELSNDFYRTSVLHDEDSRPLGTALEYAVRKWNAGEFPTKPGIHENVKIFTDKRVRMDNGYGQLVTVDLDVSLEVHRTLFYGQLPVSRCSGFKDEISEGVITNAFEFGLVSPDEVWDKWKRIDERTDLPPTVLLITGLSAWHLPE